MTAFTFTPNHSSVPSSIAPFVFGIMASSPKATDRKEQSQKLRAERGKAFGAWLRRSMANSHTGERMSNLELARLAGFQSSYIDVLTNDCWDRYVERFKIPTEPTIDKIAQVLGVDSNEGREAAGRPFKPLVKSDENGDVAGEVTGNAPLARYLDPDAIQIVRYYEALPPALRGAALGMMRGMADAGDIARQINEENTIGKRADREENPAKLHSEETDGRDDDEAAAS